jgi:predicted acyltransferase
MAIAEPAHIDSSLRIDPRERCYSIDAFRGFTMVLMLGEGFGLRYLAAFPLMAPIALQFDHMDWHGMHFWDLIQPFFMFIVGLVMPMSFERRWAAGETWRASLLHVLKRCALLILFGLIARSVQANKPVIDLINVLAQVSFTYLVAFLVLRSGWKMQAAVAFALLAAHTALYEFASAPGVAGPWVKDANIGWYLDRLVLNKNWGGSYATINCISSAANTIAGVMAGTLLMSAMTLARKMRILIITGVVCIAAGLALDPLIPIIKKIWTASFAVYSVGFTLLALVLFYWICDVKRQRSWARMFVVVGANSIFIYLFHEILHRWMSQTGLIFTRWTIDLWGTPAKLINVLLVLSFEIYVCYWLYRRKIFFKL